MAGNIMRFICKINLSIEQFIEGYSFQTRMFG